MMKKNNISAKGKGQRALPLIAGSVPPAKFASQTCKPRVLLKRRELRERVTGQGSARARDRQGALMTLCLCVYVFSFTQQVTKTPARSGIKNKTFPCLPQGGFNSGVCPGAAAITILYTYTGSPRGTLGGSRTPAVTNSPAKRGTKQRRTCL